MSFLNSAGLFGADIPDAPIDNFEDDSTEYGLYASGDDLTTYYKGDTGAYTRITSSFEGNYGIEAFSGTSFIVSEEGDGLNYYPSGGDILQWYYREVDANGEIGCLFSGNFTSNNNVEGYVARARADNDDISILRAEGGGRTFLKQISAPLNNSQWYICRAKVPESDGVIEAAIYDIDANGNANNQLGFGSTTDTTFTGNTGVGWSSGKSESSYADDLRVVGSF